MRFVGSLFYIKSSAPSTKRNQINILSTHLSRIGTAAQGYPIPLTERTGMDDNESWHLTILLLEGLRLMRPEKVWRPIITLEVDKHQLHEVILGTDGQNINQKQVFKFHDASYSTRLEVKVWWLSSSKKKRRRVIVASANYSLRELVKKQDSASSIEMRLQCRSSLKPSRSSKGRPQNGALLRVKLRPPRVERQLPEIEEELNICEIFDESSSCASEIPECTVEPLPDSYSPNTLISTVGLRKRVKGYSVFTDDEICSTDSECSSHVATERCDDTSQTCVCDDESISEFPQLGPLIIHPYARDIIRFSQTIMASNIPLPLYTEKLKLPSNFSRSETLLASCTAYADLCMAETDGNYEPVFRRLQHEWIQNGATLCALAAIDTAVFALSPGSMFDISNYAKNAIALSSIAAGVGLACDAWFLLRYTWIDIDTFSTRARDVYDTYIFFSISSRVPTMCTCLSAISLTGFLALVAFGTWPEAVLILCFFIGIVMTLQYLVYGIHVAARTVARGGRVGRDHIIQVFINSNE